MLFSDVPPIFFLVMSVANSSAFKSLLVKIAAFYRDALVWCKALSVCILIIMVSLLCPFGNSCVLRWLIPEIPEERVKHYYSPPAVWKNVRM